MPCIFDNNVQYVILKCSPLVYNSGTGVLPILVLIFVLTQYRGLVLEYCFFWCTAVLILVLKLSIHQIEKQPKLVKSITTLVRTKVVAAATLAKVLVLPYSYYYLLINKLNTTSILIR